MTYYKLLRDADSRLEKGEITLGEYEQMIKPLFNEVCDINTIRDEIEEHTDGNNHCDEYLDGYNDGMKDALEIIDRYTKGE